jgi:hypothetical protein
MTSRVRLVKEIPLIVISIFTLTAIALECFFERFDLLPANIPILVLIAIHLLMSIKRG